MGAAFLGAVGTASAQNVEQKSPDTDGDTIDHVIDIGGFDPAQVYQEYGIEPRADLVEKYRTLSVSGSEKLGSEGDENKTPYSMMLEKLEETMPRLSVDDYPTEGKFVRDYMEKNDAFYRSPAGEMLIGFKNAYWQGKKQYLLDQISRFTEHPETFTGGLLAGDDLSLRSLFNEEFTSDELGDYLDQCQKYVDMVNEGRRNYWFPDAKDLQQEGEREYILQKAAPELFSGKTGTGLEL